MKTSLKKTTNKKPTIVDEDRVSPSMLKPMSLCPCYSASAVDNAVSLDGTQCHEYMETWLNSQRPAYKTWLNSQRPASKEFTVSADGLYNKLDSSQQEAVDMCRRYTEEIIEPSPDNLWLVEYKVDLSFFEIEGMKRGIVDACFFRNKEKTEADVVDWKFGRIEVEDSEENLQLQSYAAALFYEYSSLQEVTLHLVQPRTDCISTAVFKREDIGPLLLYVKQIVAKRRSSTNSKPVPSLRACMYCANLGCCAEPAKLALKFSSRTVTDDLRLVAASAPFVQEDELSSARIGSLIHDPQKAGQLYELAGLLEKWLSAFKQFMISKAQEGFEVNGYKLVEITGKRDVLDIVGAFNFFKQRYNVSTERFLTYCKLSLSSLESDLSQNAPHGQKGKMKEKLAAEAAEQGFIVHGNPVVYLRKASSRT